MHQIFPKDETTYNSVVKVGVKMMGSNDDLDMICLGSNKRPTIIYDNIYGVVSCWLDFFKNSLEEFIILWVKQHKWARYKGLGVFVDSYSNPSVIIEWTSIGLLSDRDFMSPRYIQHSLGSANKKHLTNPKYHSILQNVYIYTDICMHSVNLLQFIHYIRLQIQHLECSYQLSSIPHFTPSFKHIICPPKRHQKKHGVRLSFPRPRGHAFAWEAALWFASDLGFAWGAAKTDGNGVCRDGGVWCIWEFGLGQIWVELDDKDESEDIFRQPCQDDGMIYEENCHKQQELVAGDCVRLVKCNLDIFNMVFYS